VGLIAVGEFRGMSPNTLPVPSTSVTSQLAQMLPNDVSDTLTINEVQDGTNSCSQYALPCHAKGNKPVGFSIGEG